MHQSRHRRQFRQRHRPIERFRSGVHPHDGSSIDFDVIGAATVNDVATVNDDSPAARWLPRH
jgi:hypothetical protein